MCEETLLNETAAEVVIKQLFSYLLSPYFPWTSHQLVATKSGSGRALRLAKAMQSRRYYQENVHGP
jgi:hypothetical protein